MSGESEAKKRRFERNVVRELCDHLPALNVASIVSAEPPEPDVVASLRTGEVLGIEVTRLHPGTEALARIEGTQESILTRAWREYRRNDYPPVEVLVHWSPHADPTTRPQRELASAIARFVAQNLPAMNGERRFLGYPESLPFGIGELWMRRYNLTGRVVPDEGHWHAPRGAFPLVIEPAMVQERLDAKAAKPSQYRGSYAERWLLISFSREGPSTWGLLPSNLTETVFVSSFDRAFVHGAGSQYCELQLRSAG